MVWIVFLPEVETYYMCQLKVVLINLKGRTQTLYLSIFDILVYTVFKSPKAVFCMGLCSLLVQQMPS